MTRRELGWVLAASLALLLLASLPTLYAWQLADADHLFSGFVYNTEDGNAYIGRMRMGARGGWLSYLFYTSEEHESALVFSVHLALGKVAAGLDLSPVFVYHLARIAMGLCLLLTVYAFVARFVADVATRRLAWALVAAGSGLGWLLTALGAVNWLGSLPLDFWVPEAFVFLVLYNLPHLALAEAALLWAILGTMAAFEGKGWWWSALAGLAAFVMAGIVPFYAGVLAAALGAYLIALLVRRRRIPWREVGLTALTGAFALPPVAYNAWLFTTNPAFQTWAAQNLILSPHPLHYLLGYALLLVPGCWGAVQAIRSGRERWLLPIAWVLAVPFLLYAPFNLQRRLIAAAQVPLALLAATGLQTWFERAPARLQHWGPGGYVALAALSNALLVMGSLGPIQQRSTPIYRPGAEVAALEWLNTHAESGMVVLASIGVGNAIPAWTDLRVFAGHGPETLHFGEKEAALQRFFQVGTDDGWRQALLADYVVDYLLYGPEEQGLGNWDPAGASYLTPVYDERGYTIYQVKVEGRP
jgi:hypothetical protein